MNLQQLDAASTDAARGIRSALESWSAGIAAGDLKRIASAFAPDALFQGLRPAPTFGREGVTQYYDSQPAPLTVDYDIVRVRPLGTAAALVYLMAVFHPEGLDDLITHITMIFVETDREWVIDHYHVSRTA